MQLDYKILWIDNDINEYIARDQIKNLREFLVDLGFQPNIVPLFDESELDTHLRQTNFDLILSDYRLDNTTGEIIENIRDRKLMTEILFYSANTNFRNDPEVKDRLVFQDRISFHFGRDTLLDRITKLIELTLNKLLELNATRGLITAETSELDIIIEELTMHLIYKKLGKSKEELDSIIKHYISDFLETRPANFKKKYEDIGFEKVFNAIDANRKWRIFRDLMKEYKKQDSTNLVINFIKQNSTYFDQVIEIRNKFAHAKAEEVGNKHVLKGQYNKKDFEFDKESCVEIRKNLIQHKNNFDELLDYFKMK